MIYQEIFTEKYRPKRFMDYIGIDKYKNIVELCNTPFKIPHFLFVGKAGTGKTTLVKIIINELKADYLILNASDESGIETIRGKVKDFAKSMPLNILSPKIIFLDEADYLGGGSSKVAQASLRAIIEIYSRTVRFILSCNYENKIIPEIHSRLTRILFGDYNKKDILNYIEIICNKENIKYDDVALLKLIDIYYPDIRAIVKYLQNFKQIKLEDIHKDEEIHDNIFDLVKQKKLIDARKIWIEQNIDCKELLYYWFEKILKIDYTIEHKKEIIDLIALTDYRIAVSATPDIQLFNFCIKVKL